MKQTRRRTFKGQIKQLGHKWGPTKMLAKKRQQYFVAALSTSGSSGQNNL